MVGSHSKTQYKKEFYFPGLAGSLSNRGRLLQSIECVCSMHVICTPLHIPTDHIQFESNSKSKNQCFRHASTRCICRHPYSIRRSWPWYKYCCMVNHKGRETLLVILLSSHSGKIVSDNQAFSHAGVVHVLLHFQISKPWVGDIER